MVFTPVRVYNNKPAQIIRVPFASGGKWGGDPITNDKLFRDTGIPDPPGQQAGFRDGVL